MASGEEGGGVSDREQDVRVPARSCMESVRTASLTWIGVFEWDAHPDRVCGRPAIAVFRMEFHRARHRLRAGRDRPVRGCRPDRESGGEAVIVFDLLAGALGLAAVVYLLFALVKPERF